jgi:glyoxylase-like metal-dependent hydrolase (beta-lactamase superfamily II)
VPECKFILLWRATSIEIFDVSPNLKLIDPQPPIPGYRRFIGSYLLLGEQVAIVDPGPATAIPGLISAMSELGIRPIEVSYVLLTHIHIDHAGGAGVLVKQLPNARVLAHTRALPHLISPENLWNASRKTLGDLAIKYGAIEPISETRLVEATDGMKLHIGNGLELLICWTPGHASHHLSVFAPSQSILIAGEAAGVCLKGAMRPATPPPFKLDVTLSSVDRLIELSPRQLCYGHFGCYSNGVRKLRRYRNKLLQWHEIVNLEANRGKRPDEILSLLKRKDSDLGYLDRLTKHEYGREVNLLINTIYGMSGLER